MATEECGVSLHIFFSRHQTAEDFMPAAPLITGADGNGEADVYCPEQFGWTETYKHKLEAVLNGHLSILEVDPHPSAGYVLGLLQGSGKRLFMPDVPTGHRLVTAHSRDRMGDSTVLAKVLYIDGDFDRALGMYKSCSIRDAACEKEREAFITAKFKGLTRIARELRKKIKAVCTLGNGHSGMEIDLGEGFEVNKVVNGPQSHKIELMRHLINGEECNDELFARALFEEVLMDLLDQLTYEGSKATTVSQHFMKKLTLDNIKWLSAEVLKETVRESSYSNIAQDQKGSESLKRRLIQLRIQLPSSPDEFNALFERVAVKVKD